MMAVTPVRSSSILGIRIRSTSRYTDMAANRFEGFFQDWANMMRVFAAVLFGLLLFGLDPAWAEVECFPHCDYWHDYGPYDFTISSRVCLGIRSVGRAGIVCHI